MLKLFKPYGDPSVERELVEAMVQVIGLEAYPAPSREESIRLGLAQADLLMGDVDVAVTEEVLAAAPNVRAVVCRTIGIDFVDVEAATRRGVLVLNSPVFCVTAVAEYALTLMLCAAHKIPQAMRVMKEGAWEDREELRGMELTGKTLGLVGYGRIGRELARMARGIGMKVLAYDPYCRQEDEEIPIVSLRDVLEKAEVVSIHSPLTAETRGMIGKEELGWMKPGAMLINVSRGGIVDEAELLAALETGRLSCAGLDVLSREPAQPGDCFYHPGLEQVLLTPHAAWNTLEGFKRNQETFHHQISHLILGKIPELGVVNPTVCDTWLQRWGAAKE